MIIVRASFSYCSQTKSRFDRRKNPRSLRRQLLCSHLTGKFHHSVYVILLKSTVAEYPSILRCNPNRNPAKPCVYVWDDWAAD